MNVYEHQSYERAAVAEAAELDVAMGRNTRTELLEGFEETTIDPAESAGPAGPEPPFDIHALGGSGMAAAVLEQPAEAGDLEAAPETLFDAATAEGGQEVPHKAQMEAAFGRSFDDVTAFLGAEGPLGAMDAEAAARGNQLAFASHTPSPDTVAHELTHVEQFRKSGGGAAPIMASGAISDRGSASEVEAEQVSQVVAAGGAAPEITAAPDGGIQRSFLSFALKMGAKKASKGMLKNFIKTRIKDKIKELANKKVLKEIVDEADQIMGILEDPWWVTAIGFVPIVGDAFDLYNVPKQIRQAIAKADRLEDKAKKAIEAEQAARKAQQASKALRYIPPPKTLKAFPDAKQVTGKTPVQGGGGVRKRWKDNEGNIFEWDSQHGAVEKYNRNGKHLGEFDPNSGAQTKGPNKTRTVEP